MFKDNKKIVFFRKKFFPKTKRVVFVGDTHGDFEASKKIIKNYFSSENIIVFLGDYVDRGKDSKKNIDFLLNLKKKHPLKIFLLLGNHEAYPWFSFFPADFWQKLTKKELKFYKNEFRKFPLAFSTKDILALHGSLPNVKNLKEIEEIKTKSSQWFQILWGDFQEKKGYFLGNDFLTGRPQFGKDWFFTLMKRFRKKILIRSHQPTADLFMFKNKCLTIFSSLYYKKERVIAVFDLAKKIKDANKNLNIIKI